MGQKVKLKMSTTYCILIFWISLVSIIFNIGCVNCAIEVKLENNTNDKITLASISMGAPVLLTTTEHVPKVQEEDEVEDEDIDSTSSDVQPLGQNEDDITLETESSSAFFRYVFQGSIIDTLNVTILYLVHQRKVHH